jgi:hypothetical protein
MSVRCLDWVFATAREPSPLPLPPPALLPESPPVPRPLLRLPPRLPGRPPLLPLPVLVRKYHHHLTANQHEVQLKLTFTSPRPIPRCR